MYTHTQTQSWGQFELGRMGAGHTQLVKRSMGCTSKGTERLESHVWKTKGRFCDRQSLRQEVDKVMEGRHFSNDHHKYHQHVMEG